MDELTELRFQVSEMVTNLDARIQKHEVSLFVLRGALAVLLSPDNPEAVEKSLEEIESRFAKAEVQLQYTRDFLQLIRNLQGRA
jgi:hypothetical protein